MERKGASYKITQKRDANHHGEHTQRTNATVASEMYGGEKRPSPYGDAPGGISYVPTPGHGPDRSWPRSDRRD